jgi:simple sugar transport system substrate-binding protein
MKIKKFSLLCICLMVLVLTASCGQSGTSQTGDDQGDSPGENEDLIVVGFSQVGAESDWRMANTKSMKETFTGENGYKLILKDAQQKQANQISAIREFIKNKVDYIVLASVSEEGWDEVLNEAKDAGIPVILVDRMIQTSDDSLYVAWVGSDFLKEGDTAVTWMENTFKDDKELKIVHLQGSMGSSAQIGRTDGLQAGLDKNSGWEVIDRDTGDFTQVKGKEIMQRILKQYDSIDVLFCENDNMAFGAIEALEEAHRSYGLNGDIAVISFDATRKGLEATLAGQINYDVECNPLHGPRVADIIQQIENGETPAKLAYVNELAFDAADITQGNIDARTY